MTDRDLAIKYAPHLYFDKNEPFTIDQIGYSVIRKSQRSPSFNREILVDKEKVDFVIEYPLYYDYDIQHMYDLEHFWVYVDYDGRVCDGEASAHGSYLNCFRYTEKLEDETHIPIYVQPGKHALMPDGKLFKLFGDYDIACNKRAGTAGLLVNDLFKGMLIKDQYIDYEVCKYIREKFSFKPSLEFHPVSYSEDIIVTWDELYLIIPERINKLLKELGLIHTRNIHE
jgi:hypothetical protein